MIDFAKHHMNIFLKNYCEARKKDFTSPCIYSKDCKQADGIGCTHTRHPDNVAKRRAEEKAKEIHIEAYDTVGRTFDKIVTIKENSGVPILSFGWPCEYYIGDLLKYNYPFKTDLCIDAGGRNHRGHTVYVKKDDVNRFIKQAQDEYWDH